MPGAIVLGVVGGMLGALFINVNTRMAVVRKKLLTKPWMKPLETFFFCFITASTFYWVPYVLETCIDIKTPIYSDAENKIKYLGWCGQKQFTQDGKNYITQQYNPLAAYFWAGEGDIIRNIL